MKQIFLFLFLIASIDSWCQGIIDGFVVDSTTKKPLAGTKLYLLTIDSVKVGKVYYRDIMYTDSSNKDSFVYHYDTTYKRHKMVHSDSNGYFKIDNLDMDYYKVRAFYKTRTVRGMDAGEVDYSPLLNISCDARHTLRFQLGVFCRYDQTKDLDHCPRCNRGKGVRIQVYGLPQPDPDDPTRIRTEGNSDKYYYNGYCTRSWCEPTKRCILCDFDF